MNVLIFRFVRRPQIERTRGIISEKLAARKPLPPDFPACLAREHRCFAPPSGSQCSIAYLALARATESTGAFAMFTLLFGVGGKEGR